MKPAAPVTAYMGGECRAPYGPRRMAAARDKSLTVLIANHNTSGFLELSVPALHELTEPPFTVLVHDDGSDPDDLDKLAALESRHPAVSVIHRPSQKRG